MKCRRCSELHSRGWHPRGQRTLDEFGDLECDDAEPWDGEEHVWFKYVDNYVFHLVGEHVRGGEDKPMTTVVCVTCGGDKFQVGSGDWVTAIKCCECGWERVIHDG